MKPVLLIAFVLVIVGALNWGLVGLAKFDLVRAVFGDSILSSIVYTLVGVSGVFLAIKAAMTPRMLAQS